MERIYRKFAPFFGGPNLGLNYFFTSICNIFAAGLFAVDASFLIDKVNIPNRFAALFADSIYEPLTVAYRSDGVIHTDAAVLPDSLKETLDGPIFYGKVPAGTPSIKLNTEWITISKTPVDGSISLTNPFDLGPMSRDAKNHVDFLLGNGCVVVPFHAVCSYFIPQGIGIILFRTDASVRDGFVFYEEIFSDGTVFIEYLRQAPAAETLAVETLADDAAAAVETLAGETPVSDASLVAKTLAAKTLAVKTPVSEESLDAESLDDEYTILEMVEMVADIFLRVVPYSLLAELDRRFSEENLRYGQIVETVADVFKQIDPSGKIAEIVQKLLLDDRFDNGCFNNQLPRVIDYYISTSLTIERPEYGSDLGFHPRGPWDPRELPPDFTSLSDRHSAFINENVDSTDYNPNLVTADGYPTEFYTKYMTYALREFIKSRFFMNVLKGKYDLGKGLFFFLKSVNSAEDMKVLCDNNVFTYIFLMGIFSEEIFRSITSSPMQDVSFKGTPLNMLFDGVQIDYPDPKSIMKVRFTYYPIKRNEAKHREKGETHYKLNRPTREVSLEEYTRKPRKER